jgi:hypothetical protein
MEPVALLTLFLLQVQPPVTDRATALGDLQAMYEQLSQSVIAAQSSTLTDPTVNADMIHESVDSPTCTFVDAGGAARQWADVRPAVVQELKAEPYDSLNATVRSLSLHGDRAVVDVVIEGSRTLVDTGGRYGPKGATHTLTEDRYGRDTWVMTDGDWRRVKHEVSHPPRELVDGKPAH